MRLALVSDIHGNLPALEAVAADIARRGIDRVVTLGDHVSGPLLPLETARFLMATDWLHIAGNHERQLVTWDPRQWGASDAFADAVLTSNERDWMRTLPATLTLPEGILVCHGTPVDDGVYCLETVDPEGARTATPDEVAACLGGCDAPVVLCGHSHLPRVVRTRAGQLVVNPGSVGLPAYDDDRPWPHAMEAGSPEARYATIELTQMGWVTSLHAVPYDNIAMARLADERGRPEWARALVSGFVA